MGVGVGGVGGEAEPLSLVLIGLNTDLTLGNSLFRSAELTKNTDPDKYKYIGYSIGFDTRSEFSLPEFI